MDMGIIYNISDQEKNTKVFNSKIRLRCQHVLDQELITFLEICAIMITVGNPMQINTNP